MNDWLALLLIMVAALVVADVVMILMGWTYGLAPDWKMIAVSNIGAAGVFGTAAVLTKLVMGHW